MVLKVNANHTLKKVQVEHKQHEYIFSGSYNKFHSFTKQNINFIEKIRTVYLYKVETFSYYLLY